MTLREEAHALGVSIGTVKRRRRARREKRARDYAARSAGQRNRLRDPATGCLVTTIGQPIYRARDPQTGRFYGLPKPEQPASLKPAPKPEPTPAAVAELVARYPLQPVSAATTLNEQQIKSFETDARKILDVIALRVLTLDARTPDGVLRMARDAERLDESMRLLSGNLRIMSSGYPVRAKRTAEPLAREVYDMAVSFLLCDHSLTAHRMLTLTRELVRSRLKLGIE